MVAQRLVGMLGLTCETADNGERALERMMGGHLDLVLMDCQMPVKDGYTAAREWRLHETAQGLPRLPIIAMTANAMAGDRQKCLDAGMDDYLSKPVDRRLLEASMARWLQRSPFLQAATTDAGTEPAATQSPSRPAAVPPATVAPPAARPAYAETLVGARIEPVMPPRPVPAAPIPAPAPAPRPPVTAAPPIVPFARPATPARAPAAAISPAATAPLAAPPAAPAPPPLPVLAMDVLENCAR